MNGPQAAQEAGVTYRQFDYWIRQGYIVGTCPGSGHKRDIPGAELEVLRRMAALVRSGVTPSAASVLAREVPKVRWWQRWGARS